MAPSGRQTWKPKGIQVEWDGEPATPPSNSNNNNSSSNSKKKNKNGQSPNPTASAATKGRNKPWSGKHNGAWLERLFNQRVYLDAGSGLLEVKLGHCNLDDSAAASLRDYLEKLLKTPTRNDGNPAFWVALELEDNSLTDAGFLAIVEPLSKKKSYFHKICMYRNKLTDVSGEKIAKIIAEQEAPLEALQLSHNSLTLRSLVAVSMAITGSNQYPRRSDDPDQKLVPCWVRMEHNKIEHADEVLKILRRFGKCSICDASDRAACSAHQCGGGARSGSIPKIHLFAATTQDYDDTNKSEAGDCRALSRELVSMWREWGNLDASPPATPNVPQAKRTPKASSSEKSQWRPKQPEPAHKEADASTTDESDHHLTPEKAARPTGEGKSSKPTYSAGFMLSVRTAMMPDVATSPLLMGENNTQPRVFKAGSPLLRPVVPFGQTLESSEMPVLLGRRFRGHPLGGCKHAPTDSDDEAEEESKHTGPTATAKIVPAGPPGTFFVPTPPPPPAPRGAAAAAAAAPAATGTAETSTASASGASGTSVSASNSLTASLPPTPKTQDAPPPPPAYPPSTSVLLSKMKPSTVKPPPPPLEDASAQLTGAPGLTPTPTRTPVRPPGNFGGERLVGPPGQFNPVPPKSPETPDAEAKLATKATKTKQAEPEIAVPPAAPAAASTEAPVTSKTPTTTTVKPKLAGPPGRFDLPQHHLEGSSSFFFAEDHHPQPPLPPRLLSPGSRLAEQQKIIEEQQQFFKSDPDALPKRKWDAQTFSEQLQTQVLQQLLLTREKEGTSSHSSPQADDSTGVVDFNYTPEPMKGLTKHADSPAKSFSPVQTTETLKMDFHNKVEEPCIPHQDIPSPQFDTKTGAPLPPGPVAGGESLSSAQPLAMPEAKASKAAPLMPPGNFGAPTDPVAKTTCAAVDEAEATTGAAAAAAASSSAAAASAAATAVSVSMVPTPNFATRKASPRTSGASSSISKSSTPPPPPLAAAPTVLPAPPTEAALKTPPGINAPTPAPTAPAPRLSTAPPTPGASSLGHLSACDGTWLSVASPAQAAPWEARVYRNRGASTGTPAAGATSATLSTLSTDPNWGAKGAPTRPPGYHALPLPPTGRPGARSLSASNSRRNSQPLTKPPSWSPVVSKGTRSLSRDKKAPMSFCLCEEEHHLEAQALSNEIAEGCLAVDDVDQEVDNIALALEDCKRKTGGEPKSLWTAIERAASVGWTNVHWKRDYTGLHLAAHEGCAAALPLIIALGADLYAKDWKGRTALDVARATGHQDCVKVLLKMQAE